MDASEVTEAIEATAWDGPFGADVRERALSALEDGKVLVLPRLAFTVGDEEQVFLRIDAGDESRKNVSLDPRTGRLGGTGLEGAERARLTEMVGRFGRQAETLVRGLFPEYGAGLERARTSFRPAEIAGRATTPRHDDKLLHVDAFPTRPLHGRRILRVFANVAPDGTVRRWRVGEPFPDFCRVFLPLLRRQIPGEAWALRMLGLTRGVRSPYDHAMLRLHDAAKLDAAYQARAPRAELAFAPGSVWLTFTDQVLHAALSGRCALEQTFHLPPESMRSPQRSPLRVLERLSGRALV